MAIQRGQLKSAYDNINWGSGVDTHAGQAAQEFVTRQKERIEEEKQQLAETGQLVKEVEAKDADEANAMALASRNTLMDAQRKYGVNSRQYLSILEKVRADHSAFAQKSKAWGSDALKAEAYAQSDPNFRRDVVLGALKEQYGKPLMERDANFSQSMFENPAYYNVNSMYNTVLNDPKRMREHQWVTDEGKYLATYGEKYNPDLVDYDPATKKWKVNVRDSVVKEAFGIRPNLTNNFIDGLAKEKVARGVTNPDGTPYVNRIEEAKKNGVGAAALQQIREEELKSYLQESQHVQPQRRIIKTDEKSVAGGPFNSWGYLQQQQQEASTNALVKHGDAHNVAPFEAFFGKNDDRTSRVAFKDGRLIVYQKGPKLLDKEKPTIDVQWDGLSPGEKYTIMSNILQNYAGGSEVKYTEPTDGPKDIGF